MLGRIAQRTGSSSDRRVALMAAILASASIVACGKDAAPSVTEPGSLSFADSLLLVVSGNGLVPAGFQGGFPRPSPAHSSGFVAAFASSGQTVAAAINRAGAVVLEIDALNRTLRFNEIPSPEFSGRTVGSLLADEGDSFLVSLYRHPDESEPDAGGTMLRLDASAAVWEPASLPGPIDATSVFSLNRRDDGSFLLATRRLEGDRVLANRWLLPREGEAERLDMDAFERLLAPRDARSGPPALRAALEELGAATGIGRILAFARNPGGDGAWYVLGDGAPETAVEIVAALDRTGTVAFAALPGGPARIAAERDGSVELLDPGLEVPFAGATWNGALIHGDSGAPLVLLLSWWVESFPDTGGAGLFIRAVAGPDRAAAL
ncbi:MAG: hypothetical protein JXA15_04375 [Spirochaetales bacterium]|nr:hypothetical protein [Spirochaetales bacterium]